MHVPRPTTERECATTTPGWAQRFTVANRRFCQGRLRPRLYAVNHSSAIDHWFLQRLHRDQCRDLLEFGCGSGFPLSRLLASFAERLWATDLRDIPEAQQPSGVTFRKCTSAWLPFEDDQFDVIVIRSVIEHVEDPVATFCELSRVLRPGGRVYMSLPNKWDYVSLAARLAGRFKSSVLHQLVGMTFDDFPVVYRCNTKATMFEVARQSRFAVRHWRPLPSEPSYLAFFVPLYVLGALYQFGISLLSLDFLQPAFLVTLVSEKPLVARRAGRQ